MSQDLTLAMRLYLDARRFVDGLTQSGKGLSKWTKGARTEIDKIRDTFNTVEGKLAAVGVTFSAAALTIQSAKLSKNLNQIGATAGVGAGEVEQLRDELFRMSGQTGKPVEELADGFQSLVASGLSFQQALSSLGSINSAMAISGANAQVLANAVTVAARAFQFDLSNPRTALQILEKMTIAGRLGNAELEDLAGVFGRVGNAAQAAGMSFDETLALIEGLSLSLPGQPEKLATRAESTLRLFTNLQYLKDAQAATGVRFFDAKGARRESLQVFSDLKKEFDKIGTDAGRAKWIQRAFGKADQDTRTGIFEILSGGNLDQMKSFSVPLQSAAGVFAREMDGALNNSVDQVGRLKAKLTEAADKFAKSINGGLAAGIKKLLDPKSQGGWELSGMQLTALGGAAAGAAWAANKFMPGWMGNFVKDKANLAGGVISGAQLEKYGVTSVFVVNMPAGGLASPAPGAGPGPGPAGGNPGGRVGGARPIAGPLAGATAIAGVGALGLTAGVLSILPSRRYYARPEESKPELIGPASREDMGKAMRKQIDTATTAALSVPSDNSYEANLKIVLEDRRARVEKLTSDKKLEVQVENRGPMFAYP
jgi:TP901 family phage tail tape measure protein